MPAIGGSGISSGCRTCCLIAGSSSSGTPKDLASASANPELSFSAAPTEELRGRPFLAGWVNTVALGAPGIVGWHHTFQACPHRRREQKPMSIFPTTILLATDGSREAQLAAATAADLASRTDSELHLIHVGELRPTFLAQTELEPAQLERQARELLDEQVRRVEEAGGTVEEGHLRLGRADEEIVDLAQSIGAGMIVMGSRGRGRIRRALMGSVSDSVVRHAHCPVTIVRQ